MFIIIRLSKEAQQNEAKKLPEARVLLNHAGEYIHRLTAETDEQRALCEALSLTELSTFRTGNFVRSHLTRRPYVQPVACDAPPGDAEIWQQLAVMASQLPEMINDAVSAF